MKPYQINSIQHAIEFFGLTQREVAAQTDPQKSQTFISHRADTPTPDLKHEDAVVITNAIAKAHAIKYPDTSTFGTVKFTVTTTQEGTHIVAEY